MVFVISVDTGEILDYEVKLLFCHEWPMFRIKKMMNKEWMKVHESNCSINHKASSEEMEAVAAVDMFSRSITSRRLKYTTRG
jgi:hypothetical protein